MRTVRCPECRKETAWQNNVYRPFCSERCRTLDRGAWASETYHLPGEPADPTLAEDDVPEPHKV